MVKKFSRDFLINELDLPCNAIENEIIDTSRWSIFHEIIFEYDGKYYSTTYSIGATEMQWERPWEDEELVDCVEVELREVKVKKWCAVN